MSLQRRAEAAGQSLQQYLTTELSRVAQSPTIGEVIERIAERSGGRVGLQTAVDDLLALPITRFPVGSLMVRAFDVRADMNAYDAC